RPGVQRVPSACTFGSTCPFFLLGWWGLGLRRGGGSAAPAWFIVSGLGPPLLLVLPPQAGNRVRDRPEHIVRKLGRHAVPAGGRRGTGPVTPGDVPRSEVGRARGVAAGGLGRVAQLRRDADCTPHVVHHVTHPHPHGAVPLPAPPALAPTTLLLGLTGVRVLIGVPVVRAQTEHLNSRRLLDLPGIDGALERDAVLSARDRCLDGRIHALARVLLLAALVVQASRPEDREVDVDGHAAVLVADQRASDGPGAVLVDVDRRGSHGLLRGGGSHLCTYNIGSRSLHVNTLESGPISTPSTCRHSSGRRRGRRAGRPSRRRAPLRPGARCRASATARSARA